MQLKQRFIVQHPPATVWEALADAPFAVQCLPGAELDASPDGRHYKGRMRVKLGPLAAAFAGDAVIDRDATTKTGSVDWVGVDARSNSRAKARMTYAVLAEGDGNSTAVNIEADVALTGALAQFGRSSIVNDVASRLTAIFAENLQSRLNAAAAPNDAASAAAEGAAAAAPAAPFKSADLNPVGLLVAVMRARLARRLRGWADRLDPDRLGSRSS